MTSYKLYKPLFLSLSLALAGCGGGGDDDETPEVTTPEATLSVANPISDINLVADTALNFTIPANVCTSSEGEDISQLITSVTNNVGFGITNFTSISGFATDIGVVNVTVTCKTETEEVTDEFTITVIDFEADPTVTVSAPNTARYGTIMELTAIAEDHNLSGEIVSYLWVETSEHGVYFYSSVNTETVKFRVPDTDSQTQQTLTFSVTVTDNDGAQAVANVEMDIISSYAPRVGISFPFSVGKYNEDKVDVFGIYTSEKENLTVTINGLEQTLETTNTTWRVKDVTLTDSTYIKALVTSPSGLINYEEVTLSNNMVYETPIDDNISDIAVNESTDDIYVHSDGALISDLHITKFNLDTGDNEELSYSKDATYGNDGRTSIATDSDNLYLSSVDAITKIDLSTNIETVLSDATTGTNTNGSLAPSAIFDLNYNEISNELYSIDLTNLEINIIDTTTGDRTKPVPLTGAQPVSVAIAANGFTYYAQGQNTTGAVNIFALTSHAPGFEVIHSVDTPTNGGNGGPTSDLALNERGDELYFVDGAGDLIKLNLDTNPSAVTATTVVENLFSVESIVNSITPLIGLYYHSERNVLIAAGRDADGTNKLLVIDPVSGDYAKVAAGTVD